jgi:GNAT superfamily N-acetyltransferase
VTTATIHQATLHDVPVLGQVIADAFTELAPSVWLVPDPQIRAYVFPHYFSLFVELGVRSGVVHTTPDRDAAAIWLPVTTTPPAPPNSDTRLGRITGNLVDRFQAFDATLERHHPHSPHQWLAMLAVAPGRQRAGIGSLLMDHHHQLLDQQHTPGYLEAANLADRDWYRARGWRDHGVPIVLPHSGPPLFPMWREPAARTGAAE